MTPSETISSAVAAAERDVLMYGSLGNPVYGDFYRPEEEKANGWSLVVCPGYGSVKQLMEGWGEALADRGFVVLVVGYTGYGDNPGGVGRIFPEENVEDVRAAIRLLGGQEEAAKVGVLGVSYGGAVALQAAAEEPVDAAISIVGYGSGARHLRALRRHGEWLELLDRVQNDRRQRVSTGKSEVISLNEILLRDEEAQEWREQVEEQYPGMRFDVTVESVDRLIEFEPEQHLPLPRRTPLLVIHAEKDSIIPREEVDSIMTRASEPKHLVILEDAEHHAVHGGEHFNRCLDEIEAFLMSMDIRAQG